jgi:hypothetical protein
MENIPRVDHEAAVAEARTSATTAERDRIAAIVGCEAAKDRPAAALRLALTAGVNAEMATAVLSAVPAEAVAAPSASSRIYGQRSQDAPGGLVVDAVSTGDEQQQPLTEHERGRAIAKRMGGAS